MKMSDVFELPMVQGSIVLMSNDHRYVIEFDASDTNTGDQIEHVAHAINNHDRMVEEIAELKVMMQKTVTAIYSHNNEMVGMHAVINCASESVGLLEKLNQEGEE